MRLVLGSIAVAALIVGCATMAPSRNEAVAELAPTAGNDAKGTVTFSQKDDTVLVVAKLSGLTPGSHGFHVHEKGDCNAPDAMSAGGHFNPLGKPHAHPSTAERHTGDMPTLVADASGNAALTTGSTDARGQRRQRHRRQVRGRAQGSRRLHDPARRQLRSARRMRRHTQGVTIALAVALTGFLAACASDEQAKKPPPDPGVGARLRPTSGSTVTGLVTFQPYDGGVTVAVNVGPGIPGVARVVVHTAGLCTSPNGFSAGPPWILPGATDP